MFKETRQFNEDMENKNYSGRLSYVHTYSDTQAYSEIIQTYLGIFRTLCKPGIFRTRGIFRYLKYQEFYCIQNAGTEN